MPVATATYAVGNRGNAIAVNACGDSYVVGQYLIETPVSYSGISTPPHALWIRKYNADGDEQWTYDYRSFGSLPHTDGRAAVLGSDGFLYIAGTTEDPTVGMNVWVGKLNPSDAVVDTDPLSGVSRGLFEWEVFVPGIAPSLPGFSGSAQAYNIPFDLVADSIGNIYVVGQATVGYAPEDSMGRRSPNYDIWIGKIVQGIPGGPSPCPVGEAACLERFITSGSAGQSDGAYSVALNADETAIYVAGHKGSAPSSLWINEYSTSDLSPLWSGPTMVEAGDGYYSSGPYFAAPAGAANAISLQDDTLYVGGSTVPVGPYPFRWIGFFNPLDGSSLSDPIGIGSVIGNVIDLVATPSNLFVTGFVHAVDGIGNIWVGKINRETYVVTWEDVIPGEIVGWQWGHGLGLDDVGNLYVVGTTNVEISFPGCGYDCSEAIWIRQYCSTDMGSFSSSSGP